MSDVNSDIMTNDDVKVKYPEPFFELLSGRSAGLEAWELRTVLHDLHQLHYLVHVLPGSDEPLQHEDLEVGEHVAGLAAHHVYILLRQLERRVLKPDVFAGRVREDEPVVDVNQVSFTVLGINIYDGTFRFNSATSFIILQQ